MGKKYLIDTNVVLDYYGKKLPFKGTTFIEHIASPFISVITQMELLGWYHISAKEKEKLQDFVNQTTVLSIEPVVIQKTIELRQSHKIKLPDAIIAATALAGGLDLISHNVSDFKNITGLHVIDLYNL